MSEQREKFLQRKLSKEESKAYVDSLTINEQKELAEELGIQEGLSDHFRNELRQKVVGFEKNRGRAKKINLAYISIAASILIASSVVLFFMKNDQDLFDLYYQTYPNYEVTILRGDGATILREKAYKAYDESNYKLSIDLFNQLDSLLISDHFFRGIALMESENFEMAMDDLRKVSSLDFSEYSSAAKWYLALISIKEKDFENASLLLEEIKVGNSEYADRAKELQEKL